MCHIHVIIWMVNIEKDAKKRITYLKKRPISIEFIKQI